MYGVVDYLVGMHYDIPSRRFKNEENEDIHYGWEEAPKPYSFTYPQSESWHNQKATFKMRSISGRV